jgi:hypothetical protein
MRGKPRIRPFEADVFEIRMRAERRLGEMIAEQRETVVLASAGGPAKIGFPENPLPRPLPRYLKHIDGVLRILASDLDPETIRSKRAYRRNRYFARNELSRQNRSGRAAEHG